jgi:hypothetical protein
MVIADMFIPVSAQQLDMDIFPKANITHVSGTPKAPPRTSPVSPASVPSTSIPRMGKPLTATVSKTLYLPPALNIQISGMFCQRIAKADSLHFAGNKDPTCDGFNGCF